MVYAKRLPVKALLMKAKASMAFFLHVSTTEHVASCAHAPSSVRLPPKTLRLTMGVFNACSARWFVAGTLGSSMNWNHCSPWPCKCFAKVSFNSLARSFSVSVSSSSMHWSRSARQPHKIMRIFA